MLLRSLVFLASLSGPATAAVLEQPHAQAAVEHGSSSLVHDVSVSLVEDDTCTDCEETLDAPDIEKRDSVQLPSQLSPWAAILSILTQLQNLSLPAPAPTPRPTSVPVPETFTSVVRGQAARTTTISYGYTTVISLPSRSAQPTALAALSANLQQITPVVTQSTSIGGEEIVKIVWVEIQVVGVGLPNATITLGQYPPGVTFISLPLPGASRPATPLTTG
ncbi:hypothetical protein HJFPF1_03852 [Paramyrothecium foliicola]|nr:hypothetical protein HJFPF1_03852 [Paramyrothecium foliicola]